MNGLVGLNGQKPLDAHPEHSSAPIKMQKKKPKLKRGTNSGAKITPLPAPVIGIGDLEDAP